jgi:hypothetical protein
MGPSFCPLPLVDKNGRHGYGERSSFHRTRDQTMRTGLLLALTACTLSGCSTLTTIEEGDYQRMQVEGVLVEEKSPTMAACLGILPGGGSFYTGNYALGALGLITWPVSVIWDPIAGYNQARVINYRASQASIGRMKQRQMRELDHALESGAVTQAQYIQEKRAIESRYGYD